MRALFRKINTPLTVTLLIVAVPAVVLGGTFLFREKHYAFPSIAVAILSCIPIFYTFERKESKAGELMVLAALIAISALGRFVFAWLPSFKPVAAIVVITGVYLGKEAGFMVGALSAVVSNFYFGQGPWTPFQMFAWGFIGFLAGALDVLLKKHRLLIAAYGAVAGVLYSLLMDVWTVVWADGIFNLSRYLGALTTSMPVMIEYVVSNMIFLLVLAKPMGDKLERIRKKYGLFLTKGPEGTAPEDEPAAQGVSSKKDERTEKNDPAANGEVTEKGK